MTEPEITEIALESSRPAILTLTTLSEEVLATILEYLSIVETVGLRRVSTALHTIVSNTGLSPIPFDVARPPFQNVTHNPGKFRGGRFLMEPQTERGTNNVVTTRSLLCLEMSLAERRGCEHAWTSASLRLPEDCAASAGTRRWKAVFIRTCMSELRPNGGYCSIKLVKDNDNQREEGVTAGTTTEDYEIKFDGNKLRGYGPCTGSDFGIPVHTVYPMEWLQLLVELVPFSLDDDMNGIDTRVASDPWTSSGQPSAQGIRMSIDGVHIKTVKLLPGNYAGICDVVFKGYRGYSSQWWDTPIWVVGERPAPNE